MITKAPLLVIFAVLAATRAGATATPAFVVPCLSSDAQHAHFFVPPIPTESSFTFLPPPVALAPAPVAQLPRVQPAVQFSIPRYELSDLEREIVAACLVLEAANQGDTGLRGVMAVIRNRARGLPELFMPTVLREKQFSALNKQTSGQESLWRAIQRAKRDRTWTHALAIVDEATSANWRDVTHGSTHYTRTGESIGWTRRLARTVVIGQHSFYR